MVSAADSRLFRQHVGRQTFRRSVEQKQQHNAAFGKTSGRQQHGTIAIEPATEFESKGEYCRDRQADGVQPPVAESGIFVQAPLRPTKCSTAPNYVIEPGQGQR